MLIILIYLGIQKKDKKVFEKMMKDADKNGDGAIEFEEFNEIMQKFFE